VRKPKPRQKKAAAADRATAYARAVTAGKIVAGPWVRLACGRHLRDLKEGKKRGLKWRADVAEEAIEFFHEMLVLEDGRPFKLEPFQCFIIGCIFGWYGDDGFRRFRTAYCEMGKGSGKSPLAAGVGHKGFIADGEPAPEIYVAATMREQAKIVFTDAVRMVDASEELKELISIQVGSLTIPAQHAVYRPVSAEHRGLDGLRVHMGLIDELHEHPSPLVVDKIRAGTKGRRNALIFEITNSGWDRHSVCWNHHEYSLKVLEGVIENDSWFAYVCALDEGDDWKDEKVWLKANPGLGVTLPAKYLREQVAEAVGMPSKENLVRRLNFCEWTEQSIRAIPMHEWDKPEMTAPIDPASLRGRPCFGGLDLARVSDLSAFALLFPPVVAAELWKVMLWFWVPEADIVQRSLRDRVPYDVWKRQGHIIATPGNTTDYGFIEAKIIDLSSIYQIREIAFDRTFAGEIVQSLMSEGLVMKEFGQGFLSMATPTAEMLRMVKAGELQHGGNPVLRFCASNLSVATDPAGNMKPDKERSSEKIDGIVAICNALGRAVVRQKEPPKQDYRVEWI
jgi:phage terminase large subunit-like protein